MEILYIGAHYIGQLHNENWDDGYQVLHTFCCFAALYSIYMEEGKNLCDNSAEQLSTFVQRIFLTSIFSKLIPSCTELVLFQCTQVDLPQLYSH